MTKTQFHKDTGLCWFDDNPRRTLDDKITLAARRHRKKYGTDATLCYVHPSALEGGGLTVGGVEVRARSTVLHSHFWIGVAAVQARLL